MMMHDFFVGVALMMLRYRIHLGCWSVDGAKIKPRMLLMILRSLDVLLLMLVMLLLLLLLLLLLSVMLGRMIVVVVVVVVSMWQRHVLVEMRRDARVDDRVDARIYTGSGAVIEWRGRGVVHLCWQRWWRMNKYERTDGGTDGATEGRSDGRTDGRTDRRQNIRIANVFLMIFYLFQCKND